MGGALLPSLAGAASTSVLSLVSVPTLATAVSSLVFSIVKVQLRE